MRSGRALILSDYVVGGGAAQGGAGHAVRDSYRALRDAGVDVRVICGFGGAGDIEPDRFTALGLGDVREQGAAGALRGIYDPRARAAVAAALASEDPDRTVVILHQWTRALTPSSLGLLAGFPTMIYMHDYFWPCPNGAYYDFREERPCDRQPLGARCIAADCDRVGRPAKAWRLVRHAALRAATAGAAPNRLVLHLSRRAMETAAPLMPRERHAIVQNPTSAGPKLASRGDPPYDFGYFGRLEPEKGVASLLDAANRLALTGLIVGEGVLEPAVHALPLLEHRRWQPRESVIEAMRSCRVVVLPSLWPETWGLVTAEAMLAGVPVLVSDRAGSAELVERFGGGAVFDPSGDLAPALAALLARAGRHDPTLAADREALTAFLSPSRHAERIVSLAAEAWGLDLARAAALNRAPQPVASAAPPAARQPLAT